jgi:hypothetical protein
LFCFCRFFFLPFFSQASPYETTRTR